MFIPQNRYHTLQHGCDSHYIPRPLPQIRCPALSDGKVLASDGSQANHHTHHTRDSLSLPPQARAQQGRAATPDKTGPLDHCDTSLRFTALIS